MKNVTKNKKELVMGALSIMAVLIAVIFTTVLAPGEQAQAALNDIQAENGIEAANLNAIENGIEAADTDLTGEDEAAPEEVKLQNPVSRPATTTKPPATTANPPATTPTVVEAPLADVEIPSQEVMAILEEFDIEVVEAPTVTQTMPPPGMPEDAQGVNVQGSPFKIEGGQQYVWHTVLGWVETGRNGNVTIMDAESSGYRFYAEPDGRVNLDKVITPSGNIISYDEYLRIKESR